MNKQLRLNDIPPGQKAKVISMQATGPMGRRLLDLGLVDGSVVECLGRSPCGDPTAFLIRGAAIALRSEDSSSILVSPI